MMAKKKIMLFIVEGPTDETSLSTVLSRIFSSDTVKFQVVHGDVLTRDFVAPDRIIAAVNEQIKLFRGNIYKPSDFCKVVHLADTDGAFIPEDAVVAEAVEGRQYPFYTDTQILTPEPANIIDRNARKGRNIAKLASTGRVGGIPYSFYYFSCNLDHVLHGRNNLSEAEKIACSRDFDLQYADDPNAFIRFMRDESFAVQGTYQETWAFIKQGTRSLERHSNFRIELPQQCDWGSL
jgi:hypothetical protein